MSTFALRKWLEGIFRDQPIPSPATLLQALPNHTIGAARCSTCTTGYRSRVAASHLQASGVDNIVQVAGGMEAWRALGYPMEAA
ncbi:MAG: rhodanese-like domain-containing protein [Thermomicrobiales bacterium]